MRKTMRKWTLALALALACVPCAAYAGDVDEGACPDVIALDTYGGEQATQPAITREGGVYEFGDTLETWYSSETLYHWRTPEWWTDEEGFWRTDEGYYVVASDGWAEGSVIETSKGYAQVLDGGCGEGIVDFYTAW